MDHIPSVFEILPVLTREDMTPITLSSNKSLKSTHLLHTINLLVRESDARILLIQSLTNRTQIRPTKLQQHAQAIIMSIIQIIPVSQTRISRRERICTEIVRLGDDVQDRRRFVFVRPIQSEESRAEISCRRYHSAGIAGPEMGFVAPRCRWRLLDEMAISGTQLDARREGFQGTGVWTGGRQLFMVFFGGCTIRQNETGLFGICHFKWDTHTVGEILPVLDKLEITF